MAGDSEGLSLAKKLKRWSSESWNLVDLLGVLCFFAGFVARNLETEEIPFWGRIFYALDIIIWYLRVLDILSVKNFMGPYVNMVGRMVSIWHACLLNKSIDCLRNSQFRKGHGVYEFQYFRIIFCDKRFYLHLQVTVLE